MIGFQILEHAGLTDVGVRRSHNQDAFAMQPATDEGSWRERGHLFLVADGMGAHAVGELASKLAADLIPHTYAKHAEQGARPAIQRAFEEANAHIHAKGQQNPEFEGMGTTTTALVIRPEGAWIAHVGDSRAYRIRGGNTEQLSYDHSLHWELARRQHMRPEQVRGVPNNVIVRSLGPEESLKTEIEGPHPLFPGDAFLLCSDGLSNQVADEELGAVISALPASEASRLLVDLANLRGGPDNITAVTVRLPGEYHGEAPGSPVRRPWKMPSLPWAGIGLGAGIALAFMALLVMLVLKQPGIAIAAFVLAALVLGAGLVGLYREQFASEPTEPEPDEGQRPPKVHRQASCRVTPDLLQRFADLDQRVEQQVRARLWNVNWSGRRQLLQQVEIDRRRGELLAAFRTQCRSLAVLTEAIRKNARRGEVFNPNWESPQRGDSRL